MMSWWCPVHMMLWLCTRYKDDDIVLMPIYWWWWWAVDEDDAQEQILVAVVWWLDSDQQDSWHDWWAAVRKWTRWLMSNVTSEWAPLMIWQIFIVLDDLIVTRTQRLLSSSKQMNKMTEELVLMNNKDWAVCCRSVDQRDEQTYDQQ